MHVGETGLRRPCAIPSFARLSYYALLKSFLVDEGSKLVDIVGTAPASVGIPIPNQPGIPIGASHDGLDNVRLQDELFIEPWVDVADGFRKLLVDEGHQTYPQRRGYKSKRDSVENPIIILVRHRRDSRLTRIMMRKPTSLTFGCTPRFFYSIHKGARLFSLADCRI